MSNYYCIDNISQENSKTKVLVVYKSKDDSVGENVVLNNIDDERAFCEKYNLNRFL